ncbi:NADPH:quinone reductase-like Zn-dependent oxidoreductase [Microbacterium phyllosphaerae]|uniref:NADPH:quinone reductase-like Zn-dependent oxidoreductase n=1 Tax=Microbacterium phyllosphaerae TaxID=124798 RepID=A0ABS4WS75_9MICO|nr:NADP-dependent oxidoreductase [Microbacterium phyllosphaerae]MBP2379069.1 NADPH:quinone reductase-like Zn-dependent oxidoreductase [Microbacterium phyllosphaerae]
MARHWIATSWGSPDAWQFVEYEVPRPGPGEVTIRIRASGVNPADAKHVAVERAGADLPVPIGYEISGEITALGPDTLIGSGSAQIGDEVIAFRVSGGYATEITIPAEKAFAKPSPLTHPEAANLLLAGTTAAEMLAVTRAVPGETILVHGASGAVGVSVLQQAARRGIRVIGTASEARFDVVRAFGGLPVHYGPGLADRVREIAAGAEVSAGLDAVGTDEAVDVSLELVADPGRIVTIAAPTRASSDGIRWIAGSMPDSARFRDAVRGELVALAQSGELVVPVAQTFALEDAPAALALLAEGHPGGKLALIPSD